MDPKTKADRARRLHGAGATKLYHQTSPEIAAQILREGKMHRGKSGLGGGGIYFAQRPEETERKATSRGCILEAHVYLGRCKTVQDQAQETSFGKLLQEGYDSLLIQGRQSGHEYVVYNWDQVTSIARQGEGAPNPARCPFDPAPRNARASRPPAVLRFLRGYGEPDIDADSDFDWTAIIEDSLAAANAGPGRSQQRPGGFGGRQPRLPRPKFVLGQPGNPDLAFDLDDVDFSFDFDANPAGARAQPEPNFGRGPAVVPGPQSRAVDFGWDDFGYSPQLFGVERLPSPTRARGGTLHVGDQVKLRSAAQVPSYRGPFQGLVGLVVRVERNGECEVLFDGHDGGWRGRSTELEVVAGA